MSQTFAIGIGGAAGQGVATPGDIFAKIFSRRGLHLNAYNAYQSIIRGGHTFLTIRTSADEVTSLGDGIDLLIPLNQDTMDRHLRLLTAGGACIYNSDTIHPGTPADGRQLCALPVSKMADISRNKVAQNTLAMGAALSIAGVGFESLESVLVEQFGRKGAAVVKENVDLVLLSEGRLTVDPKMLDFNPPIDRGELITSNGARVHDDYMRYKITESGVSPRAIPGLPGYIHVVSSDEHDEDGVLISDEYTNTTKRRAMMEKRMRKVSGIEAAVPPPVLQGPHDAAVTLIGWGSTDGVLREARMRLAQQGITSNQLQIRWLVPLHGEVILDILHGTRHTIIVENNYSGQFARYLRSETGFVPNGHIRKYDGEPFMPHHIVEAVQEQLAGTTTLSVPTHEVMV